MKWVFIGGFAPEPPMNTYQKTGAIPSACSCFFLCIYFLLSLPTTRPQQATSSKSLRGMGAYLGLREIR